MTASYIYFIAPIGGGPIKIGYSTCPLDRLEGLSSWSPYPLEILATAPGTLDDERAVHSAFLKHWQRGEWFTPHPEIHALIAQVQATGDLPASITDAIGARGLPPKMRSAEARAKLSASHKARWAMRKAGLHGPVLAAFNHGQPAAGAAA